MNLIVKLVQLPQLPVLQTLSTQEKEEFQQTANSCRSQCISLQKKLEETEAEAAKADHLLQFVEALEQVKEK